MSDNERDSARLGLDEGHRRRLAVLESADNRPQSDPVVDALAQTVREWQATFDALTDAIWVLDPWQRVVRSNKEADKLWQRPFGAVLGRHCWEVVHGTDGPIAGCPVQRARQSGLRETLTLPLGGRWYQVTSDPMFDAAAEYSGAVHVVSDVTEFKRVEAVAALNSERMQALLRLNQMADAALQEITDFALEEAVRLTQSTIGYLAFLNHDESVLTMHSWSKTAMVECAIIDKPIVYPIASTGLWGEAVRQRRPVITNNYAATNPLKKGCPAGHVLVKRHMNVPVFDGSRIVIVAGVGNKTAEYEESDIQQLTLLMEGMWRLLERKRVEAELKAEMSNLDAVFESSPVGMFILDETTTIVRVNAAAVALTGGSLSDVLQHRPGNALRCVHSSKDARGCGYAKECLLCPARNGIEALIRSGGATHGAELPLELCRNGEPQKVWLEFGVEAITLNGRRHLCVALSDITERKRAEEAVRSLNIELERRVRERTIELEASTKELEAFAYSVSHDLRAPLRSVDGFSLALLEDCEDQLDPEGKDYLRRIRAATQRMGTLIDDMLRLSRITRAEMVVEKANLTEIARSVIHELRKAEPERVVCIKIADGLEETADPKLMRIALENLLGNAWKFTGKRQGAVIELGTTNEGANKTYFVRDNGAGFDMAYVNKLFTPFQRLHSTDEYPGTGIGLGTVQRIMHRHGGKIWAEGQVEHGATFYFDFQR